MAGTCSVRYPQLRLVGYYGLHLFARQGAWLVATEDHKRRLVAILAADVAGYSRLMAIDESATVASLDQAREVFRQSIEANQGRVIDMAGDSVLAAFETVAGAVTAALAVQSARSDDLKDVPEKQQLMFRIGIHLGDVIEKSDGTVYGDGVNVAARLESLCLPGGVSVSHTVYDTVRDRIAVRFDDGGEHEVKNIARPVHAYHALLTDGEINRDSTNANKSSQRTKGLWLSGLSASILLGLSLLMWTKPWETKIEPADMTKMAFALPVKPSIAVLAFENMSDSAAQEYFSDGMSEDIITDLSKLSGLFVVARNSSFTYKGKSVKIRQIAEELGVRYVLEGSVRRVDDQVRINAQLIDAITGGHLWADRYDGTTADVFELQDRITAAIVQELAVTLLPGEQEALADNNTDVPAAHDAFLIGWAHMLHSRSLDAHKQAKVAFEKAVALDPQYPQAWGALAELYYLASARGYLEPLGFEKRGGYELLKKALTRPTVQAYRALSFQLFAERRWDEIPAVLDSMEKLEPNTPFALYFRSGLSARNGDIESAIKEAVLGLRMDPAHPGLLGTLGRRYIQASQYENATEQLEASISIEEDSYYLPDLVAAYALAGRVTEAREVAKRLLASRKEAGHLMTIIGSFPSNAWPHADYRDHLREGLRLAGIPDRATLKGLNLLPEYRVSGAEIRERFTKGSRSIGQVPQGEWMLDNLPNGTHIHYWFGKEFARSERRIEGDAIHTRYLAPSSREPSICETYRNPEGSKETLDEYLAVCTNGVFSYSSFPIPDKSM